MVTKLPGKKTSPALATGLSSLSLVSETDQEVAAIMKPASVPHTMEDREDVDLKQELEDRGNGFIYSACYNFFNVCLATSVSSFRKNIKSWLFTKVYPCYVFSNIFVSSMVLTTFQGLDF